MRSARKRKHMHTQKEKREKKNNLDDCSVRTRGKRLTIRAAGGESLHADEQSR